MFCDQFALLHVTEEFGLSKIGEDTPVPVCTAHFLFLQTTPVNYSARALSLVLFFKVGIPVR